MAAAQPQATAPITKMPPNIVSREIAFVVLLKICGMACNIQPTPGTANTLPEETRPVLGLFESYVCLKRLADTTRWNDSANRRLSAAAVKRREPTAFQCVELKEQ